MNPSYNAIMELLGRDSIKQLVKKWDTLSNNLSISTSPATILPDLFWVMNPGVGRTNLLQLLAEYLHSKGNLVDFYGDVKFFEFLLNYAHPSQPFHELQRLVDAAQDAAGFRSQFRGIVCIDIHEWVEHFREKHFISFLELMSSHCEDWLIVLTVQEGDAQKLNDLYAHLSMFLRVERLDLKLPEDPELLRYICRKLSVYGLTLADSDKPLLLSTIEKLRSNKFFDGFKTLNMLCQDIAYEHFSTPGAVKGTVPSSILSKFAVDSPYVARLIHKYEKTYRIGFTAEDSYGT